MTVIDNFRGQYRWLSNFHECEIVYDGVTYPSTEHAYQATKTMDPKFRELVQVQPSPKYAKRLGRLIFLRKDWEDIKIQVMYDINLDKYSRHSYLRDMLLQTGDAELIEGNTWGDVYWGVCKGVGENNLGKVLMRVRTHLRFLYGSD